VTYVGTAERPLWKRLATNRSVGTLGIVLGIVACLLALPPITARSVVWSALVGIVAIMCGIFAATRGERRAGWGAVASGIGGIGLAYLATRSSVGNLDVVFRADLIASMFVFSTPLIFAGIGGMFSERSGVVNIGLEGMMLMGAFFGVYGADKGGSWAVGLLTAAFAGGSLALGVNGHTLRRHRLFETNWTLMVPPCTGHRGPSIGVYGDHARQSRRNERTGQPAVDFPDRDRVALAAAAMEIDWMSWRELAQAIPPAYCELVGHQLLHQLATARR